MAVVHNVQVYPVYNTIVQVHRVLHEREYDTADGARLYVEIHRGARRGVHRRAHAASSTQSYPRASSSSASDLSPDFTMRPPASTCT